MEIKINIQYVSPPPETDGNMKINNESLSTCQRSLCALLGNSTLWEQRRKLVGRGSEGGPGFGEWGGGSRGKGWAGSRGPSVAALEGKGYLSKAGTKLNCSQEMDLKS